MLKIFYYYSMLLIRGKREFLKADADLWVFYCATNIDCQLPQAMYRTPVATCLASLPPMACEFAKSDRASNHSFRSLEKTGFEDISCSYSRNRLWYKRKEKETRSLSSYRIIHPSTVPFRSSSFRFQVRKARPPAPNTVIPT